MGQQVPEQTPEGRLIEAAAKASGLSVKKLSANAGISDTRWRHIVRGSQPTPGGAANPVIAPPHTLARMASVVGVKPGELAEAGRVDAADLLANMDRGGQLPAVTSSAVGRVGVSNKSADEIEMIYASNMPARKKLEAIRMVLHLRAEAEREEAEARQNAPARDDGAEQEKQQS